MICSCDKGLRNKLCSLSWQPACENPAENCLSLGGYCCWVRFVLTGLFFSPPKKRKYHSISSMGGCVCRRNKGNKYLRDIWKNNLHIQPSSVLVCLFFSTWFPKCNIFRCFRNQTNQGHCSDVKPCPIFHKIQESCIKFSQRTHSFNEEPVMFPHKFIAWELSSAFC